MLAGHVLDEMRPLRGSIRADGTRVRLFPGVCPQVQHQQVRPGSPVIAGGAGERAFPGVRSEVSPEVGGPQRREGAHGTLVAAGRPVTLGTLSIGEEGAFV